jgi:hypothetical protein
MLIQLPNGQWINPEQVTDVVSDSLGGFARVAWGEYGEFYKLPSDSPEQLRDTLAEQINTACYRVAHPERGL